MAKDSFFSAKEKTSLDAVWRLRKGDLLKSEYASEIFCHKMRKLKEFP
jgi:hypothetical protein